ncbi:MAG: hypothetical protein JSU87_15990 [Gemmatimonadota bacterium]|nr:MAG: hypothetical protein JSU87_15990 [Gemmatimonadota bacterium]
MKRPATMALALAVFASPFWPANGAQAQVGDAPRFALRLEAGPVWQSRNDVRIPNETGSEFSLVDLIGSGPYPGYRIYASYDLSRRHSLRLLAAPLTLSGTGRLAEPTEFAGTTFQPGVSTDGRYRFNSYRLSYRYLLHDGARWRWQIGFTAKIRDAKVELEQAERSASDSNVGFVPLLHVSTSYRLADTWRIVADLDALAAPQGRAEDFALELARDLSRSWTVAAGYRTLEGGADVDAVYTFAWLHYLTVSAEVRF